MVIKPLGSWEFWQIAIVLSAKVHLLYLPYSTVLRFCLLHLLEQDYFLVLWLRYLFTCFPITNLKLHYISATPKCLKRPYQTLTFQRYCSGGTNCEPELSYGLAEIFNKCLKKSCLPYCSKVSSVVLIFKNIGEQFTAKNYCPAGLFSVVGKVFRKTLHGEMWPFLRFPVWF